jgi:L-aminopeptidase/D-esterase-like protein
LARTAQIALARCIDPVWTRFDGDVVFSLSRGEVRADPLVLGALAVRAMQKAILRAATRARGVSGLPSALDLDAGERTR